jgi:hypothetical protein
MGATGEKKVYRITFYNQGSVYEVFARSVTQGGFFGFIEIEDFVYGEKSALIVDPGEELLQKEFENTKRSFIPMHSIVRIDEMEKRGGVKPRVIAINGSTAHATNHPPASGPFGPVLTTGDRQK